MSVSALGEGGRQPLGRLPTGSLEDHLQVCGYGLRLGLRHVGQDVALEVDHAALPCCPYISLEDARAKIEAWRKDYNGYRPHQSLAGLSPDLFTENYYAETADYLRLTG